MNRELVKKKPAQIVRVSPTIVAVTDRPLPRREILVAPLHRKSDLLRDIHRMVRHGEIGHTYKMKLTRFGWEVEIIRIRERPRFPGWIWKAAVGIALLAALAWAIRALVLVIMAGLPVLIGAAIIMAVAAALSGGSAITVTQIVKIKR